MSVSDLDTAVLARVHDGGTRREMRELMDVVTGTRKKETVVFGTPAGGALAMAVQSLEDDTALHSIFETLRASASRQFSGTRGAMFVAGLDGLSAEQMLDIAHHDQDPHAIPTGLRMHTSRFLDSTKKDHLVGVAFLSAGGLRPSVGAVTDSGGTAYYFPRKGTEF